MTSKVMHPMILVAGPSGAGKSSFVDQAVTDFSELVDIVTNTTRPMRAGESQGHPYHFVSKEMFRQRIDAGHFVEWAEVHGNLYGTPRDQMEKAWAEGKVVIMDVDVQGVRTLREHFPDCTTVFILPPDINELRQRVRKRDGGAPADLDVRMKNAEIEMKEASDYDFQLVNDDFSKTYTQFKKIVDGVIKSR
ncbi:MAG: guanylate kinase [Pseudobdellovibrionaceae bacterium]|nr:guanylate kinase [Bdellovibrionales bacterium]USN47702.1 MAG: guanylate kinase [Pseudobdellovibrionaceae bacterium]